MNKLKKSTKKMTAVLLAGALLIPGGVFAEGQVKNDYSKHWAKVTIQEWVDLGFIKGVGGNQGVVPDRHVTRAEFVRMANMRYGFTELSKEIKFSDVKEGHWFYNDIMIALKQGYIAGVTATSFAPNQTITREQAATIVARIARMKEDESGISVFKDANKISPYARGLVGGATKQKIVSGYTDGTFRPQNPLTRAEAMVILQGAFSIIIDPLQEVFTVTFDSNGGTPVKNQPVKKGEKLKKPQDPTKVGAEFLGWYLGDKLFDFNTAIDKNITLVARWRTIEESSSSGSSSSSSSYTPSKQESINNMAARVLEGKSEIKFGIQRYVDGVLTENLPNFDLTVPVAQNIHNNLDKVVGTTNKAQEKLNENASKAYKVFYQDVDGSYKHYLTSTRFDEKILDPLERLGKVGLKTKLQVVKGRLGFDGSGNLNAATPSFVSDLLSDFTDQAVVDAIAGMSVEDLQGIVRGFEKPFHNPDGMPNPATMKKIKYKLNLKINGDEYKVDSESADEPQQRDRMVAAIHNLAKLMQGTTAQTLSRVYEVSFKTEVESEQKTPGNPNKYMPRERRIVIAPIVTLSEEMVASPAFSSFKTRLQSEGILTPKVEDGKNVWKLNLAKLYEKQSLFTEAELEQLSGLLR